ncbi:MAG: hypothetical protein AB8G05_01220 [Oligoflexales bacterium]
MSFWSNQFQGARWGEANNALNSEEPITSIKCRKGPAGKVAITWIQGNDSENSLWASTFNGISWSEATQISQKGNLIEYELVTTQSGEFLTVWNDNGQIWMNTFDGENWGGSVDLDLTLAGYEHLNIEVTSDKKIVLMWSIIKDSKRYLWTSAYFDGQWDSLKLLAQPEKNIDLIKSAINYNNHLILMWKENSGESQDIFITQFVDNGWEEPMVIHSSTIPIQHENIIFHQNGKAVLTWIQSEGDYDYIYSKNYDGTTWSKDPLLVAQNLENGSEYKIATDSFSGTHLIWSQTDGSLWMNSLESSRWNGTIRLNASSPDPVLDYAIGFNRAGKSYIVWSQKSSVWFKPGPN